MERKLAVVTGACRGIGRGIATELARGGYDIAVADIAECAETMDEIRSLGADAVFVKCDISDAVGRQRLVDECLSRYGKIDVLVNNAGVAPKERMDMLCTTEESMDFVLDINLKGTFFLTQLVANSMIKSKKEGKAGKPEDNKHRVDIFIHFLHAEAGILHFKGGGQHDNHAFCRQARRIRDNGV